MPMLAEPRQKKSGWILNPRGSAWSQDDTKFGQKMLEQMGWSKGKGLGKTMSGRTEHVRASVQSDTRGLGYEGSSDDWVAHLDDFNDLLTKLHEDQAQERGAVNSSAGVNSLEEKSKKSRARVHYHKFTRGKDLSRYSSQDLACILGGRSEVAASQPVTPVGSQPPSPLHRQATSDSELLQDGPETDTFGGYKTVNTGVSVKDYFAEKMKRRATKRQSEAPLTDGRSEPADSAHSSQSSETSGDKKRSKKRRRTQADEIHASSETEGVSKKKKKDVLEDDFKVGSADHLAVSGQVDGGAVPKRKKKRTASSIGVEDLSESAEGTTDNRREPDHQHQEYAAGSAGEDQGKQRRNKKKNKKRRS